MAMYQEDADAQGAPQLGEVRIDYDDQRTLIRLRGEVDLALAGCLDFAREQATERSLPVRIDLTGVTFMDSTGLGLVTRLAAAERDHGRRLTVEGATGVVDELLRMSGVVTLIEQAPS